MEEKKDRLNAVHFSIGFKKIIIVSFILIFSANCMLYDIDDMREKAWYNSGGRISIDTQPADISNLKAGFINGTLSVSASVPHNATLNYQWYSNTINSNEDGNAVLGATNAVFTIPVNHIAGTYYYYCEIKCDVKLTGNIVSIRSGIATVTVVNAHKGNFIEMVWIPTAHFQWEVTTLTIMLVRYIQ